MGVAIPIYLIDLIRLIRGISIPRFRLFAPCLDSSGATGASVSCLLGALLLLACSREPQGNSIQFFAMDTPCTITLQGYVPDSLLLSAEREVQRIEAEISSYIDDSEIGILNREGHNTLSPENFALLQQALSYAQQSNGIFDPTIGALSQLWDITASRALKTYEKKMQSDGKLAQLDRGSLLSADLSGDERQYQVDNAIAQKLREERHPPDAERIAEALKLTSWENVELNAETRHVRFARLDMKLDLGGIAKGYAADRIAAILVAADAPAGVIDLGGNILLHGNKKSGAPWSVGIRGERESYLLGMFLAQAKAVVTSGIYQRYYMHEGKRYHHILSTRTGYPIDNGMLSVTVVTDSSTAADALSTLLFIYGFDKGLQEVERRQAAGEQLEALFVTQGYQIYGSGGFARLSKTQYEQLENGQILSRELSKDKIWVYPIEAKVQFVNM